MSKSTTPKASAKTHFYQNDYELALCSLEVSMFGIFESIQRWQEKCVEISGGTITGPDNSILNCIRLNESPKSLSDIAQFLNRSDLSNIQYAIRKLKKQGLIQQSKKSSKKQRKDTSYEVTEEGYLLTEKFGSIRKKLMFQAYKDAGFDNKQLQEITVAINKMTGIYESLAREATLFSFE